MISDLLASIWDSGLPSVSFEYFPPRTDKGVDHLKQVLLEMKSQNPVFVDFTWGAGGSTSDLTLELSKYAQQQGFNVNMHLTCTNMPTDMVKSALDSARDAGIRNIVALRGDPPKGSDHWEAAEGGFACALDLVKYIRGQYGDYFGIAVAGYPEGHPNVIHPVQDVEKLSDDEKGRLVVTDEGENLVCSDSDFEKEIAYLKEKVDAGANLIICQMFFDVQVFFRFVKKCRQVGIKVPILPGIMPITKMAGFKKMIGFCKTRVPTELRDMLEKVKEDAEAVEKVGRQLMTEICKKLVEANYGLHFYCLNQFEATYEILRNLKLLKERV